MFYELSDDCKFYDNLFCWSDNSSSIGIFYRLTLIAPISLIEVIVVGRYWSAGLTTSLSIDWFTLIDNKYFGIIYN